MTAFTGPPPKRGPKHGHHKEVIAVEKVDLAASIAADVEIPVANEKWHGIAKMLWNSLAKSGESIFYEPSDWAVAYLLCESLSRDLKPQFVGTNPETGEPIIEAIPLKGASMTAYLRAMGSLMMLEGDRRKLRIELEREKAKTAVEAGEVIPITQKRQGRFA